MTISPLNLYYLRPLIDFGLVILIWLVQLIIYPSFLYSSPDSFQRWHNQYTSLILLFVGPLMLSQVVIIGSQLLKKPEPLVWSSCLLIAFIWGYTFFVSVPKHSLLSSKGYNPHIINQLVQTNWPRTIAWTLCFILSILPLKK